MLRLASFLAANGRPFYEAVAGYLGHRLGVEASLDTVPPAERDARLDAGDFDVGFLCGLPYAERHDRPDRPVSLLCAPVLAAPRYGGRPVYFTDVIVRADDPARDFADLRGRTWAYNDVGSHSGYNVVRHHLLTLGAPHGYFARVIAAGAHQRSIRMVAEGAVDASGIDSGVLELELAHHPELRDRLRTLQTIGPSPIPPVVVTRRVGPGLRARLRALLLGMAEEPAGRAALAEGRVARFVPVADADYDPIRATVRRARAAGVLTLR